MNRLILSNPAEPRSRIMYSVHNIQFGESYDTRLPAILEGPLLANATR